MSTSVRRGDVFWANLDPMIGVEIKKTRPVIVVSNDVINERSRLVIVVPLTTNVAHLSPSHVLIPAGEGERRTFPPFVRLAVTRAAHGTATGVRVVLDFCDTGYGFHPFTCLPRSFLPSSSTELAPADVSCYNAFGQAYGRVFIF